MDIKEINKKVREIEVSEYRTSVFNNYLLIMLSVTGIALMGWQGGGTRSPLLYWFLVGSYGAGLIANYYFIRSLFKKIIQLRVNLDAIKAENFTKHINEFLIKRNFLGMSKCCKAEVEIIEGALPYYVCKKCGRPCELYFETTEGQPDPR